VLAVKPIATIDRPNRNPFFVLGMISLDLKNHIAPKMLNTNVAPWETYHIDCGIFVGSAVFRSMPSDLDQIIQIP